MSSTASNLGLTVEAEDLRSRLIERGVQVSDDTSLDGLRELAATFLTDPHADTAAADALTRLTEPIGDEEDEDEPDVEELAQRAQAAATKTDPGSETLFPPSDYDDPALTLPAIDGHPIDRIAVGFSGEVMLDRGNKDHVQLWKRLKLGREVELWVSAKGLGFTGKGATNRDGELDVIVGKRTVSIQTVRILAPEELADAAREIAAQAREADATEAAAEQATILDETA